MFNYESPGCNNNNDPTHQTVSGITPRAIMPSSILPCSSYPVNTIPPITLIIWVGPLKTWLLSLPQLFIIQGVIQRKLPGIPHCIPTLSELSQPIQSGNQHPMWSAGDDSCPVNRLWYVGQGNCPACRRHLACRWASIHKGRSFKSQRDVHHSPGSRRVNQ